MIKRYFVGPAGRVIGECLVAIPANPDALEIIEHEDLENPTDWVKSGGGLAFSPEPVPTPTNDEIITALSAQIQKRLDDFAKTRRYDNVTSGTKYDDLTDTEIAAVPAELQAIITRYRAESRYLKVVTAQTWAKGELLTAEVLSGMRPVPASIADIEADLPTLAWPV